MSCQTIYQPPPRVLLKGGAHMVSMQPYGCVSMRFAAFVLQTYVNLVSSRDVVLWNPESGLCMDVMGDQGVTVGTGIMLSGCEFERTNSDHVWNFDPQTGLFRNRLSGLCLDVEGQRATHGLPVQIAVCETILANTGLTDQAWQVQPVDGSNGSFVVNKAAPTRCLGTEGYPYMYWHVYLRDCLSENNTGQLWELIDVCQMPGTNAYTRKCTPVCSRTEYVKDFQCFPCPVGKVGQADACVPDCAEGTRITDDMLGCEDEDGGLTGIQWAAIGAASAVAVLCAVCASRFIYVRWKQNHAQSNSTPKSSEGEETMSIPNSESFGHSINGRPLQDDWQATVPEPMVEVQV